MGVMRILDHLEMFPLDNDTPKDERSSGPPNTVLCSKGFWVSILDNERGGGEEEEEADLP